MYRKYEKTGESNISVICCCIAFTKAIHANNISPSTLKTALQRNDKTTKSLASFKCSQKKLFDAVESELDGSSNNDECILISKGIMHRRENVRKTSSAETS